MFCSFSIFLSLLYVRYAYAVGRRHCYILHAFLSLYREIYGSMILQPPLPPYMIWLWLVLWYYHITTSVIFIYVFSLLVFAHQGVFRWWLTVYNLRGYNIAIVKGKWAKFRWKHRISDRIVSKKAKHFLKNDLPNT